MPYFKTTPLVYLREEDQRSIAILGWQLASGRMRLAEAVV